MLEYWCYVGGLAMSSQKNSIKPYGRKWNSDRSAPDYDPQRDPYNPDSPVFGQWPRDRWFTNPIALTIVGSFLTWFGVTLSLIALKYFGLISSDTFITAWAGRYFVLIVALAIGIAWSLIYRLTKTPRAERGTFYRHVAKRAAGFLALVVSVTAVCLVLDWLEKYHDVPFLLSAGVLIALYFAITQLIERRNSAA